MSKNLDNLKQKAKDLEEILLSVSENGIDAISGESVLPKLKAIAPLDYEVVKTEADKKASDIVEAVILLYLTQEFVAEHDYVYQKMEVDKLTVSNILFQMKTAEHAIKKLLEEIDGGTVQARMFEVLASLQKSKMEIVKHLTSFMVIMENNYKNLNYDWNNNVEKQEALTEHVVEEQNEYTTKYRGTKSLMTMVQGYVDDAKNKKSDGDYQEHTSTDESEE
jgi:hypothetical protein